MQLLSQFAQFVSRKHFDVPDEAAMERLGAELAPLLPPACLITLTGELGAGKSLLARSIIHAFGYEGRVKSPTYTLMETYSAKQPNGIHLKIAHLDLYRLNSPEELDYLGFDDILNTNDLVMIEWPEQAAGRLPQASLEISIAYSDGSGRAVELCRPACKSNANE